MFLHHQVVNTEDAFSILHLASEQTEESERTVVQLPCICRYQVYGSDTKLRCFGIAFTDQYTRKYPNYCGGSHRYVSAEEAHTLLEQLVKEEPIVHAVSAMGVPYIGLLCNCDMQVCSPYLSRLRLGITSPFYKAHHRAQINKQICTGCGICANVCPFQVADITQLENIAKIDSNACYGCGICLRHCPENAISLVPVDESVEF